MLNSQFWDYRSKYSRAHSGDDDEEMGREGALAKEASLGSPASPAPPKEFTFVGSGFAQCVALLPPYIACHLITPLHVTL